MLVSFTTITGSTTAIDSGEIKRVEQWPGGSKIHLSDGLSIEVQESVEIVAERVKSQPDN